MKNRESRGSTKVSQQPQIKERKAKILSIVKKNPSMTSREVTYKFIEQQKLKPKSMKPAVMESFLNKQRHNVKYALNQLLEEKKVKMVESGAARGGWKKMLWRCKKPI